MGTTSRGQARVVVPMKERSARAILGTPQRESTAFRLQKKPEVMVSHPSAPGMPGAAARRAAARRQEDGTTIHWGPQELAAAMETGRAGTD